MKPTTLNRHALQSLMQDCATSGNENLADPTHPLADELATIPIDDLHRISQFMRGYDFGATPTTKTPYTTTERLFVAYLWVIGMSIAVIVMLNVARLMGGIA